MSQLFASGGQSISASASASVLPMNVQGLFLLGLTGWIPLLSKGLSESSPTPQLESINSWVLSLLCGPALTSVCDYCKNYSLNYTEHCWQSDVSVFNMLSRLVIAFILRSKRLLISWLQSQSAMILEAPQIKSVTVSTVSTSICHEVMGPDAMILVF